jgi:hypothetical protein
MPLLLSQHVLPQESARDGEPVITASGRHLFSRGNSSRRR